MRAAWFVLVFVCSGAAWSGEPGAPVVPETPAAPASDSSFMLDAPLEPFVAKQPRTAAEADQLEALSLYAAGRTHEQREDYAAALRLFQRALRYDPDALPLLREIVPLAFRLNRTEEAVRYALKVIELDPSDPQLLRQLGAHLAEKGDGAEALGLYERALATQTEPRSATAVVLSFEVGRLHYLAQRYTEAAGPLRRVAEALEKPDAYALEPAIVKVLEGEQGRGYELLAEVFLEVGDLPAAERAIARRADLNRNEALHGYFLARLALLKNQPDAGLVELEKYLAARETKKATAPYKLLDELLSAAGRAEDLTPRLVALRAEDPANIPLTYFLASRHLARDEFDLAEPLFRDLLHQSSAGEAFAGLTQIYLARRQIEPLAEILAAVVDETGDITALGDQGRKIAADAELVAALVGKWRERLTNDDASVKKPDRLAAALLALEAQQFDLAREWFELAIKVIPPREEEQGTLYLAWGVRLVLADRYDDAARHFRQAIEAQAIPADNPVLHFYLSGVLEMTGQTDEALRVAEQALRIGGESARLKSRVAWILYHAKRYDAAYDAYHGLVEQFRGDYEAEETREALREARLVLSNLCVLRGELAQAEEWLEQVLDEYPDDVSAQNDLGYLWVDQGRHLERALVMIQRAVAAAPDNIAYRDSLGWAFFRLGRWPEALAELERAAAGENTDGVILEHLGETLLKLSRAEEAREAWRRAVAAFERDGETEKFAALSAKLAALEETTSSGATAETSGAAPADVQPPPEPPPAPAPER